MSSWGSARVVLVPALLWRDQLVRAAPPPNRHRRRAPRGVHRHPHLCHMLLRPQRGADNPWVRGYGGASDGSALSWVARW
ncbi:hypothetical protein C8R45DRAFT_956488 [Mycena sanguinolenta]|nr:hypothetical protein C8R45DRAFT_1036251 [Mycena sanguinolenta]KAJ6515428.1 hypothetical protein C8R45DRAFT_956488 [Mycena sanguinolenta]